MVSLKFAMGLCAVVLAGCASTPAPIALKSMGSFHIGGREVTISGKPIKEIVFTPGGVPAKVDPNGVYQVEQMYVQYFIPQDPFNRFRIGAGPGSYDRDPAKMKLKPGSQFPAEGYDNFTKQGVPRWTTTDDAIIRAYIELVDKVCPCVVLIHSQSGTFGQKVAQARPEKVKALVLVEPAGPGDAKLAANLKSTPILAMYGDYIDEDPRWPIIRANELKFLEQVKAAGGRYDVINLPQIGIKGNTHMMMMDKNSDQVADVIQGWLAKQGLYRGGVRRKT